MNLLSLIAHKNRIKYQKSQAIGLEYFERNLTERISSLSSTIMAKNNCQMCQIITEFVKTVLMPLIKCVVYWSKNVVS